MQNTKFLTLLSIFILSIFSSCNKSTFSVQKNSNLPTTSSTGDVVLTPYGYLPASHVHEVSSNTYGTFENGHVVIKELSSGKIVQDLGVASAEDIQSSHTSAYAYAEILRNRYAIASPEMLATPIVTRLSMGGSGTVADVPNSSAAVKAIVNTSYSTNITGTNYTGYYMGDDAINNVQSFSTTWVVPAKSLDTTNLVTTFLWNGLSGGACQPVLEWDEGRGAQYAIRNWYFAAGQYWYGSSVLVNPGTTLTGVISFVSNTNDTTWTYKESFTGYPAADVTLVRNSEATGLAECFEPYTSLMSQWPNQAYEAMKNISLTLRSGTTPTNLTWSGYNNGPRTTPTGANSVVVNTSASNGEIDFYFGDGTGITPDSTFQIVSAENGSSVLDVYQGNTANGTKVELWSPNSPISPNQEWVPISLFNGYYKIESKLDTTKVLEVAGGGTSNGTQVDISSYTGASYQQWKITPSSTTYGYCTLSPANISSSNLDDYSNQTTNGNKIEIWTANSSLAHLWKFNYISQ